MVEKTPENLPKIDQKPPFSDEEKEGPKGLPQLLERAFEDLKSADWIEEDDRKDRASVVYSETAQIEIVDVEAPNQSSDLKKEAGSASAETAQNDDSKNDAKTRVFASNSKRLFRDLNRSKSSLRMRYEAEVGMIRKKLGDLESIRKQLGLSQRRMCQLLFVDPSAWTRWTKGGENAPPHIYRMLQWYLALEDKYPAMDVNFWLQTVARVQEPQEAAAAAATASKAEKTAVETAVRQVRMDSKVDALGSDLHALQAEISRLKETIEISSQKLKEQSTLQARSVELFERDLRAKSKALQKRILIIAAGGVGAGLLVGWWVASLLSAF